MTSPFVNLTSDAVGALPLLDHVADQTGQAEAKPGQARPKKTPGPKPQTVLITHPPVTNSQSFVMTTTQSYLKVFPKSLPSR